MKEQITLPACLVANSKLCSKLSNFKQLEYENNSWNGCRDIQFSIFQFYKVFQVFLVVSVTEYSVALFYITRFNHSRSKDTRFMQKLSKSVYIIEKTNISTTQLELYFAEQKA